MPHREQVKIQEEEQGMVGDGGGQKGEKNSFYGKKHTEESKQKMRIARGKQKIVHSEETKKKMSEAQKGRTFSEETKQKMRDAAKKRCANPEWKKRMSDAQKRSRAEGRATHLPPVLRGKESPNYGKKITEETRERMSIAAKRRGGHLHTEESRQKISEGNARAIKDRIRKYLFKVKSPCGGMVPCRTVQEERLANAICYQQGVKSVTGEDKNDWVSYEIDGQRRQTVADFMVTRSDGQIVVVEGKDPTSLYIPRERARFHTMWRYCQEMGYKMILALNNRPMPDMYKGPFVTQEFADLAMGGKIRVRKMETNSSSQASKKSE